MRSDAGILERVGPSAAAGVAALSTACAGAAVALHWWKAARGLPTYPEFLADVVVAVLNPLVGVLLVARQPRNACGWVLVGAGSVGVSALAHQWAHLGAVHDRPLAGVGLATWLSAWTFAGHWIQPSLLALLFPDGRPASPRWRRVVLGVALLCVVGVLGAAFRPDPDVEGLGHPNPLGLGDTPEPFLAAMAAGGFGGLLAGGALGVLSLFARLRRAAGRERAQVQWLLLGFTTFLGLAALSLVLPWAQDVLFAAGTAAIPGAVAIAVVRHRLLDIELVVNRTLVYAVLTALGLAAYALVVSAAGALVDDRRLAPLVAAAVALAAAAGRSRVQRLVDRRLFGARRDPYAVVDAVGARIAEAADAEEALTLLVASLRDTLRLPYAAVEPAEPGLPRAALGSAPGDVEEQPVVWEGRRLATLRVARRRGERLLPEERSALVDVARRAAGVLHAARLTTDLQRSRERLVAAREEERRRLRADLHDGLGPALAGLGLHLDGLRRRLPPDGDALARADRLGERLTETVGEVRRIVDGLRPVALDDLGLEGALRRLLPDERARVEARLDVPDPLPALPAAVEVAAYRIVAEALANALRHSGAARVAIHLAAGDGVLEAAVADDGRGFGADVVAGVGLSSMHERAAEVGGALELRSDPGAGTTVLARLPLARS